MFIVANHEYIGDSADENRCIAQFRVSVASFERMQASNLSLRENFG
jgi:hypothetical protein